MTAIAHAGYMTGRHLRALARQPWYIAFTLLQPLIYLLIFGALFEKASLIPGFGSDSYITFLTPGVLVMSALFTAVWNGMNILEDMKRGTLDRFLVTPVWRGALIAGPIANAAVSSLVQAGVILGVGMVDGVLAIPGYRELWGRSI
jgi:ABC-2 type transport system permease protein